MYTTSTCPHCISAKTYLIEKGYDYIEKNIQLDQNARSELAQRKVMGVPAFVIGEETVVGFDRLKIESLLDYTVESCPSCEKRVRLPKGKGKVRVTCKACNTVYDIMTQNM